MHTRVAKQDKQRVNHKNNEKRPSRKRPESPCGRFPDQGGLQYQVKIKMVELSLYRGDSSPLLRKLASVRDFPV